MEEAHTLGALGEAPVADVHVHVRQSIVSGLPHILDGWLGLVLSGAAVLGLLGTVVQKCNPLKDVDLTVVRENAIQFSLPAAASSVQKLAMTYDGRPVPTISLVRFTLVNSGNQPIHVAKDSPSKEWMLALRSSNKVPIERVGDLIATPAYVQASTLQGPTPDVLYIKVGLLKPRESVSLQLAVIGNGGKYSITSEEVEPRIPDLRLADATDSVQSRVANAFAVPLWIGAALVLLALSAVDIRRGGTLLFGRPMRPTISDAGGLVFVITFASALFAAGVAWTLSWAVYWAAFH
jgi:hypothetical protein